QLEKIRFKLRQLRRPKKRSTIDDERRQSFKITVLARLHFQHEVDQRAFEPRTGAVENRETCGGNFCRSFKIEYSQRRTEIDVVLWCKRKLRRLAPTTHLNIRTLINPNRHG